MKKLLLLLTLSVFSYILLAQTKVSLWQGTSVHAPGVTLELYLPSQPSSPSLPSIVVCPGGSYCWHDYETEGTEVARWLQKNGIAAFVLRYRVQGIFNYVTHMRWLSGGNHHPDMIEDAQRALQWVREHADSLNIDPHRVGFMGFSAGGHLTMSTACYSHTDFLLPLGIHTKVSLRPDFVVPIYPVVTMHPPYAHKRSRRALLGEQHKRNTRLRDSLSLERHVPMDCPPVFLVNCKDDPVVRYENSVLLDSVLTAKGIRHKYLQYQTGGHGFGASSTKGTSECRQWKTVFLEWLKEIM